MIFVPLLLWQFSGGYRNRFISDPGRSLAALSHGRRVQTLLPEERNSGGALAVFPHHSHESYAREMPTQIVTDDVEDLCSRRGKVHVVLLQRVLDRRMKFCGEIKKCP